MPDAPQSELRPAQTPAPSAGVNREVRGEPNATPDSHVELGDIMPIASYEGEKGYPFAVEYYKMETPYEFLDSGVREDLEAIDTFVKDYIKDEDKEDTVMSYSKTLKALEKKLGIDDNTMRTTAIKKIADMARNFNKVADAFNRNIRRKVLAKLVRMSQEGFSDFDQTEYILEKLGGIV